MDQTTLFNAPELRTEEDVALLIRGLLADQVKARWGDPEWIRYSEMKGHTGLYFLNEGFLLARIVIRKKTRRLEMRADYKDLIPETIDWKAKKDSDYIQIELGDEWPADLTAVFRAVIDRIFESFPTDFSVCASYAACSDAMKCLHPGEPMYMGCSYRKKLFAGISFYGEHPTR